MIFKPERPDSPLTSPIPAEEVNALLKRQSDILRKVSFEKIIELNEINGFLQIADTSAAKRKDILKRREEILSDLPKEDRNELLEIEEKLRELHQQKNRRRDNAGQSD